MRSDLQNLYPPIYQGILETDLLTQAGDAQFNQYFAKMDDVRKNQFAFTADAAGLTALERIYEIRANPAIEDLEFRRQRLLNRMRLKVPFTFRFLLQRFDEVIGAGAYKAFLGRGGTEDYLDQAYTLFVSVPVNRVGWYEEIRVFVDKIKPANMIFAMHPLVTGGLGLKEQITAKSGRFHYLLGSWRIGNDAFYTLTGEEAIAKMDGTTGFSAAALEEQAAFTASQVVTARINGAVLIDALQKELSEAQTIIRYIVRAGEIDEITQIELLGSDGEARSHSRVAVPVPRSGQLVLEHVITHKEVKE